MISLEKRELIIFDAFNISVTRNQYPPIIHFPRVQFNEFFIAGAPKGTFGLAIRER